MIHKSARVVKDAAKLHIMGKPNPEWVPLGAELRQERLRRGLTHSRAGTLLRMRPEWVKRMEDGIHDPEVLAERWGWVKEREKAK